MTQAEDETLMSAIHKLINSIWNKEELPDQLKEYIILPFHKKAMKLIVIIIVGYHSYQLYTIFLSGILFLRLSSYIDEITRDHQHPFQHIRFPAFVRCWKRMGIK
jgi:hypothetical protein